MQPQDEADAPNVDKAKKLLAEAGYPNGFSVKCKSVYLHTQKEATLAIEMFKAIGVQMELIDVEYGAFLKARNTADFDLIASALAPFGDVEDFTTARYTHFEACHPHVRDYVPAQNPERGLGFWRAWVDPGKAAR